MIYIHIYQTSGNTKKTSRNLLKENLSHYLDMSPTKLNIQRNNNGKPSIDGIDFSVSHSKGIIVQAFTKLGKIGIDVEQINSKRNYLQLAQRYFHKTEHQYLQKLSTTNALTNFYIFWTTKEAVCKAHGERLWYYLSDNYLDNDKKIRTMIKGLKLFQLSNVPHFSLTVATANQPKNMAFIYA